MSSIKFFTDIRNNKKFNLIIVPIIIALIFEIFVFNFPAFRTLINGNKLEVKSYELDDKVIKISNINKTVTSINIDYKEELFDKITYIVKFKVKDNSQIFELKPKVILKDSKQFINFDSRGICEEIEISLITENDIQIDKILLNKCNFNFNIYRAIIIFVTAVFILKIRDENLANLMYNKNSRRQNYIFIINLTTFLVFVILYIILEYNPSEYLVKPEDFNIEDSVVMQAESFAKGKIELPIEPSENLKNMKNPYDNEGRYNENVDFLYDVAYYNGHYYNYFGIAPIITLILPFRLITGKYLHTFMFNFVFMIITAYSLYALYRKLVDKYIKEISLVNFYLGYYVILFGSNLLTLLRGAKYDIVVTSGIAFLLLALNFAFKFVELINRRNEEIKEKNLNTKTFVKLTLVGILFGICTALIVLSKPNLIVWYLLILFVVLDEMKENNLSLKENLKYFIFPAVPLGAFAVFQMIYNYVRFDNILEFGAKYQLTDVNMTISMGITFGKTLLGFMEYIFRIPRFDITEFPFVFANRTTGLFTINEICYEARLVGLIGIPILWIYLFRKNILNCSTKNSKQLDIKQINTKQIDIKLKKFTNVILVCTILAIIVCTSYGGICEAYAIDFKLVLVIGAVLLGLKMVENKKENKKDFNKILLMLCVATIIIMVPLSLTTEMEFLSNLLNEPTVFLKNIFEFWA